MRRREKRNTENRHDDIQIWRYKNKYIQVYSKCMRRYSEKFMRWGAWFKTLAPHKVAHGSARRVMQGWKRCKLAPRSHPCSCHRESCNGMKRLLLGSAMGWRINRTWEDITKTLTLHKASPSESWARRVIQGGECEKGANWLQKVIPPNLNRHFIIYHCHAPYSFYINHHCIAGIYR